MSNVLVKIHTKKPAQNEIKILFCMQVSIQRRRGKNALYNERKYVKIFHTLSLLQWRHSSIF